MGWGRLRILALSWLASVAVFGAAFAQPAAPAKEVADVGVRLVQVTPRLPLIHAYALAQDESGNIQPPPTEALSLQIGPRNARLSAASDEGVAVVFLVDVSKSLKSRQTELVMASLKVWIGSLRPNDRAAIMTFGSDVKRIQGFTGDKAALTAAVQQLKFSDDATKLYEGLVQAINLARRPTEGFPVRRAIILLTDGQDDQTGGADADAVREQLRVDPVPIYALGFAAPKDRQVDAALKKLSALVVTSGGDYLRVRPAEKNRDPADLDAQYARLRELVNGAAHYTARCDGCEADGTPAVFQLMMRNGTRLAPITARLVGPTGEVAPKKALNLFERIWEKVRITLKIDVSILLWTAAAALAGGGAAAGVVVQQRRKQESENDTGEKKDEGARGKQPPTVNLNPEIAAQDRGDRQRLRLYPIGRNDLEAKEAVFERKLTLGRDPGSDICIGNDGRVSAHHCTVEPQDGKILIRDVGSRNGTRVNGVPVSGFMHAESDSILGVGRTEIRLRLLPAGAS